MLFAFEPVTNVLSAVGPFKDTITLLHIVVVRPAIFAPVSPLEAPVAVLFAFRKVASEVAPVLILKRPLAVHTTLLPLA